MSPSIIPQLVRKDFLLSRKMILVFALVSLASSGILAMLHGRIPDWVLVNLGFILLLGPAATCGIVLLMKTNVFEKEKATQAFIMSLPVSVKQFTQAKLLINLPVFTLFWLAVSGVAYTLAFGTGLFPPGTIPFVTMVLFGAFVAYTCILGVSLLFQSLPWTVLSITIFEMGTSAYLWAVAFMEPISAHVYGPVPVWNATAVTVIALQALVAVSVILATLYVQGRKRDFV